MSQVLNDAENMTSAENATAEQPKDSPTEPVSEVEQQADEVTAPAQEEVVTDAVSAPSTTDSPEQPEQPAETTDAAVEKEPTPEPASVEDTEDVNGRSTPTASEPSSAAREHHIPRSQSADPMSRASRMYSSTSAITSTLRGSSSQASMTGDDSSISTTGRRSSRKKRSKSVDPSQLSEKKKASKRKVVIDDFELVRVLGKGCAGKVLLVRHKPTSGVYALKAITKRHVLAHQELQHTLTEQAVLKRMAADNTDPFVVRLWWSFHDKEYLYLVMVSRYVKFCPQTLLRKNRTSIPVEIWQRSLLGLAAWAGTELGSTRWRSWRA